MSRLSRLVFGDIAVNGDDAWVCGVFYSALFHIDLRTLEISFLTILPARNIFGFNCYERLAYWNGKLIIAPNNSERILIYSIKENKISEIALPLELDIRQGQLFKSIFLYNNYAYMFPGLSQMVVKLDLFTNNIDCISIDLNVKQLNENNIGGIQFYEGVLAQKEKGVVYFPCLNTGFIMRFDMNCDGYSIYSIDGAKNIVSVNCTGEDFIISESNSTKMYIWDGLNKVEDFIIRKENYVSNTGMRKIFKYSNFIYFIPIMGNMILKMDCKNNSVSCFKQIPYDFSEKLRDLNWGENKNFICCKMISDNTLICYSVYDGKLVKLNFATGKTIEKDAIVNETDLKIIKKEVVKNGLGMILEEERGFSLDDIIIAVQ